MTIGNSRRRDLAIQPDPAALAALRAVLAEHAVACRLPGPWRDLLVAEAAGLLDASRRHLAATDPSGFLTKRGMVKAALRAHLALQPRLERVLGLLGLDEPPRPEKVDPMKLLNEHVERMRLERESAKERSDHE